jgi:hypothetical protein
VERDSAGLPKKVFVSLSLDDISANASQDIVGDRIVGFAAGAPTWAFKSKSAKAGDEERSDGGEEDDEEDDNDEGQETCRRPRATMDDVKAAQATHCGGMMMTTLDEKHAWVLDIKPAHEGDAARAAKLVRAGQSDGGHMSTQHY